ncbi:hypothetical protein [Limnoglobus roseus]|uniref:Uncharacterized protein n=1 Tax=Limnoglobus roseus TaxID=2598579 RepID=A0A5C1AGK4_9BACT|nr:hypothetical protein [Limnoglobus roseus]QEL18341.1 hypothetical protein PX52LOC_05362 [Limnoglobus roseus]
MTRLLANSVTGHAILTLAFLFGVTPSSIHAQSTDEVKQLQAKVAELEAKLKLAEKEAELLKKELALPKDNKSISTTGKSLSARLKTDSVLSGSMIFDNKDSGKLTITITDRTGDKVKAAYKFEYKEPNGKVGQVARDLEGEINDNRVTFKSVGRASKLNITLSMKDDALNGSVTSSEIGGGKVGLKFGK